MRLFIAIELCERIKKSLAAVCERLRPNCPDVRWTRPAQLHLTLKFLGEVSESRLPELNQVMTRVARTVPPFEMTLDGTGVFPASGRVRIVWAGLHEPGGILQRLAGGIENGMAGLGFPREERDFSPHITLGRVKDDRSAGRIRKLAEQQEIEKLTQRVSELTLMSSKLSAGGSIYAAILRSPLECSVGQQTR